MFFRTQSTNLLEIFCESKVNSKVILISIMDPDGIPQGDLRHEWVDSFACHIDSTLYFRKVNKKSNTSYQIDKVLFIFLNVTIPDLAVDTSSWHKSGLTKIDYPKKECLQILQDLEQKVNKLIKK